MSPFRRNRVLLALGPLAGTVGAIAGVAAGLDGPNSFEYLSSQDLRGFGLAFYFLATLATLAAVGLGWSRGNPFHALKACSVLAVANFFPGMFMAKVIEGIGC